MSGWASGTGPSGGPLPPSLAGASWLVRPTTQAVLAALNRDGRTARIVGGAVRNALIGLDVTDIDIATDATPEEVVALAAKAGLASVPTGIDHGTVTVISQHTPFEVTTLRQDVEAFGRHARVSFTGDWAEDARRRDFTLNALYCTADGTVLDPLGGYPDVVARRVRFIGDAEARIREDYLRILRFFRFHAQYGHGTHDAEGLAACLRLRAGLAALSAERVRAELVKLLVAPGAVEAAHVLHSTGLLLDVLGRPGRPDRLAHLAAIEKGASLAPCPARRLALLAVDTEPEARAVAQRLRLSVAEQEVMIRCAGMEPLLAPALTMQQRRAVLYRLRADTWRDRVLAAWARAAGAPDDPAWQELLTLPGRWPPPSLPVAGRDVLTLGIAPGPEVGALLAAIEREWIARDFVDDRPALLARLAELAGAVRAT